MNSPREYSIMFMESETFWRKSDRGDLTHSGQRRDMRRGVKFHAPTLQTAKNIAIGFAEFVCSDFTPELWEHASQTHHINRVKFPQYQDDGFRVSSRRLEVRLIDLTAFEMKNVANKEQLNAESL